MIQRQVCQWLRAIAENIELTPAQAENLTKQQAATYLTTNYPQITTAQLKEAAYFFNGIKEILLRDALQRQLQARLILFKTRIETSYPEAVGLDSDRAKEIATEIMPYLYGEV